MARCAPRRRRPDRRVARRLGVRGCEYSRVFPDPRSDRAQLRVAFTSNAMNPETSMRLALLYTFPAKDVFFAPVRRVLLTSAALVVLIGGLLAVTVLSIANETAADGFAVATSLAQDY
jgi:hypothetical protein